MALAEADNAARSLSRVLHAFLECDDDVQTMIQKMLKIVHATNTDDQEKEAAALTVLDALFPDYGEDGQLGFPLDIGANDIVEKELDAQEERFVARVKKLMKEKGISQIALSEITGVNQSAIAMMMKRNCRPQRRTVKKLAKALGVDERMLWP